MAVYQVLTDRDIASSTAITPTTLIHIVTTGDTSQGNPAGSSYKAELQQLSSIFSGGTFSGGSGNCITDLYVSNIHSCSPLNINPLDEGNVYFGSTSGVTIDVTNSRVGIGTDSPSEKLHVSGNTKITGTLNIGTLGTGTSINTLGIDSNGFVVTATTTTGITKYAANVPMTGSTVETVIHSLGTTDVAVQLKDSTGKMIIPDVVDNYTTNTVDITVSSTETYKVIIIG